MMKKSLFFLLIGNENSYTGHKRQLEREREREREREGEKKAKDFNEFSFLLLSAYIYIWDGLYVRENEDESYDSELTS